MRAEGFEVVDDVRRHLDEARADEGAARLAAEAGDHQVAYALLLDAVAAWERALAVQVDAEAPPGPPEPPLPPGFGPLPAAADPAGVSTGLPAKPIPVRHLPEPAPEPETETEPDHESWTGRLLHRFHDDHPHREPVVTEPVALDDLLADYEQDPGVGELGEWVNRLYRKRVELQRVAAEVDRGYASGDADEDDRPDPDEVRWY